MKLRIRELHGYIWPADQLPNDLRQSHHVTTIWCGVTLESAWRWLKGCGWGPYLRWRESETFDVPGLGTITSPRHQVSDMAPLRLRLRGRCWIEDPARPATLVRGYYDPVDLPARVKAAAEKALNEARARLRPNRRGRHGQQPAR